MVRRRLSLVVWLGALLLAAGSVRAELVTMHAAQVGTGNQVWGGVGLTFDVVSSFGIRVQDLGVYDSGPVGIQGSTTLSTYVFDTSSGDVLAQMPFASGDAMDAEGSYLFKSLSHPLYLAPGRYTIMGYGWDAQNPEYNNNNDPRAGWPIFDGGGSIEFVESVWTAPGTVAPGTLPVRQGNPDYFNAANMRFVHVPVPGAALLGVLGLGAAGFRLRKRAGTC